MSNYFTLQCPLITKSTVVHRVPLCVCPHRRKCRCSQQNIERGETQRKRLVAWKQLTFIAFTVGFHTNKYYLNSQRRQREHMLRVVVIFTVLIQWKCCWQISDLVLFTNVFVLPSILPVFDLPIQSCALTSYRCQSLKWVTKKVSFFW